MISPDLDNLERLAKAATSGPWQTHDTGSGISVLYADHDIDEEGRPVAYPYEVCLCTHSKMDADAAFIAALNPEVALDIIALARRTEQAEVQVTRLRSVIKPFLDYANATDPLHQATAGPVYDLQLAYAETAPGGESDDGK